MPRDRIRSPTEVVVDSARAILRALQQHPEGLSFVELGRATAAVARRGQLPGKLASAPTMRRALGWLRTELDAPIRFSRSTRRWTLNDPEYHRPLLVPDSNDLEAALLALALVTPLGDPNLVRRMSQLVEDIDLAVRRENSAGATPASNAIRATFSRGPRSDARTVATLIRSIGRKVVSCRYDSVWTGRSRKLVLEPWQLRFHDGVLYLRAWSRLHREPRNFRVARLSELEVVANDRPQERRPRPELLWGSHDPDHGLDHDRPGTARVRVRGPAARLIAEEQWHPAQRDHWLVPGELLEREFSFGSCREFARRLLSLGQELDFVEPKVLRDEILAHAKGVVDRLEARPDQPRRSARSGRRSPRAPAP